jgi:hypothetical protein
VRTPDDLGGWVEITGDLDRQDAEAFQLELQRLAQRYGLEVEHLKIEPIDDTRG